LKRNCNKILFWYHSIVDEKWKQKPSIHRTERYDEPETKFGGTATIPINFFSYLSACRADRGLFVAWNDWEPRWLFEWTRAYSAAAYRRFAPIGDCLYKKLLELFSPFANSSVKADWNSIEKGYFLLKYFIFSQKKKTGGSICGGERYSRPKITFGWMRRQRSCFVYDDNCRPPQKKMDDLTKITHRSAEPRRQRSCFVYDDNCRPPQKKMGDLTKITHRSGDRSVFVTGASHFGNHPYALCWPIFEICGERFCEK
jgi:hypothetical protein